MATTYIHIRAFTNIPPHIPNFLRCTHSHPTPPTLEEQTGSSGCWSETQTSDGTAFVGRHRIKVDGKEI
ncbi:hypothetical protein HYDPIDRAFT_34437 [Hydnomerulius pinastri MD-312]|uniref:Uncharacterized protein n=1 Tax=Hydnomerulius pinastri MD-312 TaxID=994086 RepID=A0A0C9VKV5_9AGAM|nr:hypothetical protein HYDPIDRAFT_34437 [Hydnomerulius pinastri MD-312]